MKTNVATIRLTVCLTAIFIAAQSFAFRADDETSAGMAKGRPAAVKGNPLLQLSSRETVSGFACRPGRLLVRFTVGMGVVSRARILTQMGGATVEREYTIVPGLCLVKIGAGQTVKSALADWNGLSGVVYAEPDYEVKANLTPNDPRFNALWGMHNTGQTGGTPGADIDAPEAWDMQTGSRSVVVAVIDSGVDYNHEDLAANMWINTGEIPNNGIDDDRNGYIDDVYGINAITGSGNPMDDNDHGTHCSGTIGGVGNNGVGVAGVCWNVQIMALKFLGADGSGSTADAITCIEYAIQMHAKVLSNSWGGGGYEQSLKNAIDAAGAADIVFCAAAGNDGTNNDTTPSYPCGYSSANIIAVMATDDNDLTANFSNYGRTTVDLAAPGVDILSCKRGGGYVSFSGTSMATPHVAGACGLLLSHNSLLSVAQLKDALLSTVDVPTTPLACVSSGRMNVARALAQVLPAPTAVTASKETYADTIRVTWDAAAGATNYAVYRNTSSSSSTALLIASTTALSYDDIAVSPGVVYYYWVKATGPMGTSGFSAMSYGFTKLPTATGMSASQGTSPDSVRLSWIASSGAAGYIIYRNQIANSNTASEIARSSSSPYDDTAATPGTTYYYWIKVYSVATTSLFSSVASGYRGMPAPGGVSASGGTYSSGVLVSWNGVSGAISYLVSRSASADSSSSVNVGETAYTSFVDASAAPGIIYYYWVQSKKWSLLSSLSSGSASGWRRSMAAGNDARGDFDGDGIMDFAVYMEATGMWYVRLSGSGYSTVSYQLGSPGFVPVSCDYDGDGRTDPTVYYEPDGLWIVLLSASGNTPAYAVLGGNGFKPVAGDYDGDGRADGVVYQEATGTWKALLSKSNYNLVTTVYGGPGCKPAAADYDGDGLVDPAVYYELPGSNLGQNLGFWYMALSGSGYLSYTKTTTGVGLVPVPADYDGDGKADIATYNSASGVWSYWSSANNYPLPISFTLGGAGYTAVPADYDGDTKADIAVYHEATGQWYFLLSSQNYASSYGELGGSGYEPVGARR